MINEKKVRRFCNEDISLIENYDKAMTDMAHTWHCHHRLEVGEDGEIISMDDLKKYGLYYDRPASELIFLTRSEHKSLHSKNISQETRKKLSESMKGKQNFLGHHHTEEHRRKISEAMKGKVRSEEHCRKLSEARKGKYHPSEEAKKKISESLKVYWEKKRMTKE